MQFKNFCKHMLEIFLNFIKNKNVYFILLAVIPFISLDIITRSLTTKITFFAIDEFVPCFFTAIWCIFLVSFALSFKKIIAKTLYSIFFVISFALYLVNNIYYSMTEAIFDFHLTELASEGSSYFMDAIKNANPKIYWIGAIVLALFIFCVIKLPTRKKNSYLSATIIIGIFIGLRLITPTFLGEPNTKLSWDTWYNPRNVYINFNDSNKSYSISGLYEYSFKNFCLTFLAKEKTEDETQIEFLKEIFYSEEEEEYLTEYTGLFKDKNVIFLQMEGIDNWLVTKETMPNLYKLLNNSINFTNHYSYYNGGGSTFNSEFAVNTGYLTPITYTQNAYTFNKNTFTYSMAHLFKNVGYSVNAFHMNSSEYYSRGINYNNWGFDKYYGLKDLNQYTDSTYQLDRELILNETFYDLMFKQEGKFVDYIITYSTHMPFTPARAVCKLILDTKAKEEAALNPPSEDETTEIIEPEYNYTEEECIKIQAGETDYMISLLMKALEDNGLLDNTIIVGFTDHYLYNVSDKTILDQYKDTSNNLINKTPFFIWSNKMKKKTITKVTSQVNILPTVLNLAGLEYHKDYYTGEDALNKNYQGIAFFNDYSWYDGKIYVENGQVALGNKIDATILEEKNNYINFIIKKNDLVLKYDYFKQLKNGGL